MKSILDFKKKKKAGQKITMVTCYDNWSAKLLARTDIDCLLVGDSLSMVMHGYDSTVHATVEMMASHTQAVARGADEKLIVSDLPFLSHRKGEKVLMDSVEALMKAGAQAVKIETALGQENLIQYVVDSGVPVMGHIGLTPQFVHQLGGYKLQGRDEKQKQNLYKQAIALQEAGCFAIVLECIPSNLALNISKDLSIPTIGIGAGPDVDGQVLVLHDLLGLNPDFKAKFVRHFSQGNELIKSGITDFIEAVQQHDFPNQEESYQ